MNVACSRIDSFWRSLQSPPPTATAPQETEVVPPPSQPEPISAPENAPTLPPEEAYQQALDAGFSAASIAQSAQSGDDWGLVILRWQQAIELLQEIPEKSTLSTSAQAKIAEYQRNLRIAQDRSNRPLPAPVPKTSVAIAPGTVLIPTSPSPEATNETPETTALQTATNPSVFTAPIKRRAGRTPVVDVMFNGEQSFEMVLDTGASGTVITQKMANQLGIVTDGEITADTASNKGVKFRVGRVKSVAINGAVAKDVRVAISGPELDVGLLGQDFFGNYDILIKQDVVEFRSR
ncbi:MAG: retroviral-like aspartic protease family protein [Kastovskya adunca ATA6-11-RM4]|jgi:predicted aspartyl protease|nr:retroviral-like aspartic protease family protein [Kastovskya adunca ATA6-11-RM4]